MIRGLIFDCHGVLYGRRAAPEPASKRKEVELAYGLPRGALKQTLLEAEESLAKAGPRVSKTSLYAEAHRRLEALAGKSLPNLHLQLRRRQRETQELLTENIELIRQLHGSYQTAALANSNGTIEARLQGWGIRDIFDLVFDSQVEGIEKPAPAAYTITVERLGLTLPECVFIDDTESNVARARELGMVALHYDVARGDDLAAMLAAVGVVPAAEAAPTV